MRKTFLLTAMLLAFVSSIQGANKLTAGNVKINNGETAELVISMENDIEVGAYDFHLYLPKGVTLVYDEDEEDYIYELTPRHNKKHQLTIKYDDTDNSFMLGVADPSLHKLKNNSGEILTLQLMTTADAVPGTFQGNIKKIWFAESGTSGVDVADATFTIEVVGTGEGITDIIISNDGTKCHTLSGQQVDIPSKGVYIKNGKKMVKK